MRRDLGSIEAGVSGRRVLAKLEHEPKRVDSFGAVHRRIASCIKHFRAEGPKDRHEIGDGRVASHRTHNIAAYRSTARRAVRLALVNRSCGVQHIVPRGWLLETVLLEQVAAIEK